MAIPNPSDLVPILDEYRTELEQCRALYESCALECSRGHIDLEGESEDEFVGRMVDLSNGLMLKVFLSIASLSGEWSRELVVLAGELFEFVWAKRLKPKQVKEALSHFHGKNELTWNALLGPFQRLGPFRRQSGRIQTIVMRLANLVAKANGKLSPDEIRQLRWIQAEMRRLLEPLPLATQAEMAEIVRAGKAAGRAQARAAVALRLSPDTVEDDEEEDERPVRKKPMRSADTVQVSPEERLRKSLTELDTLIGLQTIKYEVRGLVNFLKMQRAREEFDLPATTIGLHHIFSGNPGTGKTTVARLLGQVFGALGVLSSGHLVETDRAGLVAEYAGQTAPKTHKIIDEALDGVLFIDEAYSLVADKGEDPYGAEALQALLKRMEDERSRLVVILAGYPRKMRRLLRSNPGLSSRFSRQMNFPDYSAVELGRIFESLCRQDRYTLPPLTRVKLLLGFQHLLEHRDEHFGNGRLARNIFEHAIGQLANRISGVLPLTKELLTTLEHEDIDMEGVPAAVWQDLTTRKHTFRMECPGCQHASYVSQDCLGQKLQCRRCQTTFDADWSEMEADAK